MFDDPLMDELDTYRRYGCPLRPDRLGPEIRKRIGCADDWASLSPEEKVRIVNQATDYLKRCIKRLRDPELVGIAQLLYGCTPESEGLRLGERERLAMSTYFISKKTLDRRRKEICRQLAWLMYE